MRAVVAVVRHQGRHPCSSLFARVAACAVLYSLGCEFEHRAPAAEAAVDRRTVKLA
jgi:hypothetical protein